MKRRIIKQGHSTHTITLPAKWIKKYSFKAGDEVEMNEQGRNLLISSDKNYASNSVNINITNLSKFLIQHHLLALYRSGADEIELRFDNPVAQDLKKKQEVKVLNVIQDTVNELIGVEIIRHTDKSCVIKQLSEISEHEFDNVLRRIFLLLTDLAKETHVNIKNLDYECLHNVKVKYRTINKFVNFCLRLLNKRGHKDYRKTALFYHLISGLDMIAQTYEYISLEIARDNRKINPVALPVLENVNKSLHLLYEMVFKFENNKTLELLKIRRTIFDDINSLSKKLKGHDVTFFNRLSVIVVMI
ncbi:hypothetical protein KY328_01620, partial [Candidatus Woesearchaeota archaeon]|nr:hypothetical protein [Candidatus Woesearchaeota archaeon]